MKKNQTKALFLLIFLATGGLNGFAQSALSVTAYAVMGTPTSNLLQAKKYSAKMPGSVNVPKKVKTQATIRQYTNMKASLLELTTGKIKHPKTIRPKHQHVNSMATERLIKPNDSTGGEKFCTGAGICSASSTQFTPEAIPVTFCTLPGYPLMIAIGFSLQALTDNQVYECPYIRNGGNYVFGEQFDLSDPMFSKLQLPTGAFIPASPYQGSVTVDGDNVIIIMPVETP